MDKKAFKVLEYYKILEILESKASSEEGKKLCHDLKPVSDIGIIESSQTETKDALDRVFRKDFPGLSGLKNPAASIKRMDIGGTLNAAELLSIAKLLKLTKLAKAYAKDARGNDTEDSLDGMFAALEPVSFLREEIDRCIIAEDEFADDASPGLAAVRRSMRVINDRIHSTMQSIIGNQTTRGYLQDSVITMRNGRYCIPVKAENKSMVPGMIHDQSSSGSTYFVEPMAVVKLNNELREAFLKEQEEIDKVLAVLSNYTAENSSAIQANYEILVKLDFIFAKAKLAREMNGSRPVFNTEGIINIRNARHPLLDKKAAVPINVYLGENFHQLIVTGPNTGGKTVSIKTVGLLTLMGQAGLHIPAGDRSRLAVFEDVFADIGDEQSIEQNLSTFSSHMKNIVKIISRANPRSLVLFDELCSGTDPAEGAALAISILDYLRVRNIRTMATTHYSELKVYASSTKGVENACCEFDVETLSPTYRLLIGIPGKSNAFAISTRLGLPETLINDARTRISSETENFEDVIAKLETDRLAAEELRFEAEKLRDESAKIKAELEKKQEKLDSSRDKLLREANEKAASILREAKEVADETIRTFHKYEKNSPNISKMEEERQRIREKMDKAQGKASIQKAAPVNMHVPKKLMLGDEVKVLSMNLKGTVHTLPDAKGNLFVQMGIMRTQVNIKDLVLIEEPAVTGKKNNKGGTVNANVGKAGSISPEINLIGMNSDDAIAKLDKYLDDAYISNLKTVRIVHGKGTGALRKAVHNHLKRMKHIDNFRLGEFGEGDAGVTIAEFK